MADLTITAANVRPGSDASTERGVAGEALTAGMSVYLKTADSKWYKADANLGSAEANASGVALTNASADEGIVVQTDGEIVIGATLTVGQIYILSSTGGGIAPVSDLASGWYPVVIGIARTASIMVLNFVVGPVTKA